MKDAEREPDLRPEQVKLLNMEKAAAALIAAGVALPGVANAATDKLGTEVVDPAVIADWQSKFVDFAAATGEIHAAFEAAAVEAGATLIQQAGGGTDKGPPAQFMEKALSLLGIS